MSNCLNCAHNTVCKYEEEYLKFEGQKDVPEFIKMDVKCKYFTESIPTPKQIEEIENHKCDCFCVEESTVAWNGFNQIVEKTYRCNGTQERDECNCGGDTRRCTFYPEKREKK